MAGLKRTGAVIMAAALIAGLGACRPNELSRPTSLEKGVYTGQKDSELTPEQVRALQQRMRRQSKGKL